METGGDGGDGAAQQRDAQERDGARAAAAATTEAAGADSGAAGLDAAACSDHHAGHHGEAEAKCSERDPGPGPAPRAEELASTPQGEASARARTGPLPSLTAQVQADGFSEDAKEKASPSSSSTASSSSPSSPTTRSRTPPPKGRPLAALAPPRIVLAEQRNAAIAVSVVEFHVTEGPSIQEVFPEGLDAFDAVAGPSALEEAKTTMTRSRSKSDLAGLSSASPSLALSPRDANASHEKETSPASPRFRMRKFLEQQNASGDTGGAPISPSSRRRAVTLKLEKTFRARLAFLALPDRADAQDQGFSYFLLRQAPALVAGVSCFRQVESSEAVRHKHQRALVVLCDFPLFDYVRSLMEVHVDDILWAKSAEHRLDCMRGLHAKLSSLLRPSLCREPSAIQGPATLSASLRLLGGSRHALTLLKCLLLGNTGVMVTGPAAALVSQIVLSVSGILPRRGGMLGTTVGEDMRHSARCRELAELAIAVLPPRLQGYAASKQRRFKSKLLLMPYCSLLEMDDLREVYTPRVTSKAGKASELQGRCGYFAGTTNPVMASSVRNGLGDLILEVDDAVLETAKAKSQAQQAQEAPPSPRSADGKTSGSSAFQQQFERFSSRAARFVREKTDEVVTKLQQLNSSSVRTTALTPAGRVATDLGGKDRAYARKIDRVLFARESKKRGGSAKQPARARSRSPRNRAGSSSSAKGAAAKSSPTETRKAPSEAGMPAGTPTQPPAAEKPRSGTSASFSSFMSSLAQLVDIDGTSAPGRAQTASPGTAEDPSGSDPLAYKSLEDCDEAQSVGDGEVSVVTNEDDHEEADAAAAAGFSDAEVEAKVQELFVSWMNSLFTEIAHYIDYGSLPNAPHGSIQGLHPSHNQDYLREWARRTQTTREKNTCSEVVQFSNGDEYRGEILISDADGFVDLDLDRRASGAGSGWGGEKSRTTRSRSEADTEDPNTAHDGVENPIAATGSELRVERQGRGVYMSARTGWRHEGAWENDVRHGSGVAMLGDAYIFDGAWEQNKRSGRGTCIVKGKGQVSGIWDADVLRQGIYFDAEGNKLDAVFDDNGCVEEGLYMDATGKTSYKGRFSGEGRPHGVGNASYADDSKYSGTFSDGERHGQGAWSVSPAEWYAGGWQGDLFHGDGILAFRLAERTVELEATWVQGKVDTARSCCVRDATSRERLYEGVLSGWDALAAMPEHKPPTLGLVPRYSPEDFACLLDPLPSSEGKVLPGLPSDSEYETESE